MKFQHEFIIKAPIQMVVDFHKKSASMGDITPPPIRVIFQCAPEELAEGDEIEFTLWMGPVPVRWLARIEEASPAGFTDRQLSGPFREWVHRHTFIQMSENRTKIVDQVQARLDSHPFTGISGMLMWLGMPILFSYRAWKTRRLLENKWLDTGRVTLKANIDHISQERTEGADLK